MVKRKIKILIAVITSIVIIPILYFGFLRKEKPKYSLATVQRGEVIQEISESGIVKMGEEIGLSFKNSGQIKEIYVKTGDETKEGQDLARLNITQLSIQLKEAKAALVVAQSQFEKILSGASVEEIKIARTIVANAQMSLENARQNLEDVKRISEENTDAAYEDALNILDEAHLKSLNSFNTVKPIQLTYFTKNDQEGIKVRNNKNKIEEALNQINFFLDKARTEPKDENINLAVSETKKNLEYILQALIVIRQTCDEPLLREIVSSAEKTSLDTSKTNINAALTNVTNSQQAISLTVIANTSNINTAQAQVSVAEGNFQKAQDELSQILAPPRQEDIDLYRAKTTQAEAQVNLFKTKIEDSVITSPFVGKITDIKKRAGETVQIAETVLSFLSTNPFQVQVDIYEGDIVKVKTGNPVEIKLAAFTEKIFEGKVVSMDPSEKIIEGIVYYRITIDFQEPPAEIKPGMTADIVIKTASKDNVIVIPEAAIEEKNGEKIVMVLEGKTLKERKIEIGLKGREYLVEVLSGLQEGEKVVVK